MCLVYAAPTMEYWHCFFIVIFFSVNTISTKSLAISKVVVGHQIFSAASFISECKQKYHQQSKEPIAFQLTNWNPWPLDNQWHSVQIDPVSFSPKTAINAKSRSKDNNFKEPERRWAISTPQRTRIHQMNFAQCQEMMRWDAAFLLQG